MNGFREIASLTNERTNERTDERTNERDSLGLQRLRRETKKWTKYRFKQPKCIVLGTPKEPKRAKNELTHSKK